MLYFFLLSLLQPGKCYSVAPRKSGYPAGVAQFLEFLESVRVMPSSGFPWITLMQSWIKPPGVFLGKAKHSLAGAGQQLHVCREYNHAESLQLLC